MKHNISVSKEYIDTVCRWLEKWADKKDSLIIPQFLKKYGLGWSYFQAMLEICPQLNHIFENTIAGLCSKWLAYGLDNKEIPAHMRCILNKYMRVYDNHAYYVDQQAKKELTENTQFSVKDYEIEDYSQARLKGLYKRLYEENTNKSRD